jgi:hypothetical protein
MSDQLLLYRPPPRLYRPPLQRLYRSPAQGPRATKPLRVIRPSGTITSIQISIVRRNDSNSEVRVDDNVVGFVCPEGHAFIARVGTSFEQSTVRGSSELWDKAAAMLLYDSGLACDC